MKDEIYDELRKVIDPEIGFDIVSLGLIYGVDVSDKKAVVTMTLSTRSCPLHELILSWVEEAVLRVANECEINLVWEPTWDISMASDEVKNSLR
ncbi:metal-sulfur cluster assembly factor [Campylobacter hyointestinalis]|uniref:metal-sulfur cluster assembly factor n=1 Tax=Campylobacter hyointestinalis TaxID=198 RepID=UPI000CE3765C|nr:metal-sulfur cluster assembly factor [Campylobacter hyointestinalis]PPB73708.1 DNA methyltransferase [Campylobacter hyointestinalis subsp. hyointestinalis]PPB75309.1 DNA methyltransferase [Campylobacter hyointestinalis subsp. hyointestinalis]PPB76969.1 DNA methyltransferase [Campylobacter hyointestinalis subsp. hyointestinalis]PPB79062.1 DNA methyltransferase [Campylobacter hyointestinalis subsp. hyointestinalis]